MDITYLYNKALVAFFILLIGIILGKIAQRLTLRFMKELEISYLLSKATKIKVTLDKFVSKAVAYTIYLISVIIALNRLGILRWALIAVAGFVSLAIIAALFLYFVSLFPNLWARFKLRKSKIAVNKQIALKNMSGKIKQVSLQYIKLDSGIHIPYFFLLKNKFRVN